MCLDLSIVVLVFYIFVFQWIVFKQQLQETRELQQEELAKALAEIKASRAVVLAKGLRNQREELIDHVEVYDVVTNNRITEVSQAQQEMVNTIEALCNRVASLEAVIQTHIADSDRRLQSLNKRIHNQRKELIDRIEVYDAVTNNRINDL